VMTPVGVALGVAVVAIASTVAIVVVRPREPTPGPSMPEDITTWCDNPSLNRIYQSSRGGIAVVPRDPSCGAADPGVQQRPASERLH